VPGPKPVPPPAPPADVAASRELGGATRNRPSADEERELGEIAAQLARGAQPRPPPAAPRATAPQPPPAVAAEETNVLEPADVEDIILGDDAAADIPDAALEFDMPAAGWEQVFVRESGETAITALDLNLEDSAPRTHGAEVPDELVILDEPGDSLARTDEYQIPDFAAKLGGAAAPDGADIELELTDVAELEPARVPAPAPPAPEPPPLRATRVEAVEPAPARPRRRPPPAPRPIAFEAEQPAARPAGRPAARAAPRSRLAAAAGVVAGVLLVAGLAAQAVHYNREALAESPLVGPALGALYARLGMPIEPRWDAASYEVRQWGAQTEESAGVLRLRASIINRAAHAQPYPLLRVTLEDRFGTRVGRREFTPAEYLPGRSAPREPLAPGARADADLSLADPGNQAVGFELDVCYTRHHALACGSDAKSGGS